MIRRAVILVWLFCACGRTKPTGLGGDDGGAGVDAAFALPPECADASVPPTTLLCTGLYADIVAKDLAPGIEPYAPAVPLWSDGADKHRWISLPAGTLIDNTDPTEWIFPDGTKLWKEFSREGRRVETRLWQKVHDGYWVSATYAWNDDESSAAKSAGGDIMLGDGAAYHIPTQEECQKCHRGRIDHILGFDQVGLGLSGASGFTLETLVAAGRLLVPVDSTSLTIGDDGTQAAAPALGWLHANCGTTCHNSNPNATGYAAGMHLRLDPTLLDGRSSADFEQIRTTVGVVVNAPAWAGQTRIVAGNPGASLLYHLISHRGDGDQMPPFASALVDEPDVALVEAWIRQMPPTAPPPDAGQPGPEPAADAGSETGGMETVDAMDVGVGDVSTPDDDASDAGPPWDGETPDADAADETAAEVSAGLPAN